jgi:crossover junction endonuclease MUS81
MLTEEGKKTARDCLARSGLDDTAGPLTRNSEKFVLSDSDCDEPYPCDSDCGEPYHFDSDCHEPYPCDSDCDEPYPCDSDSDEPAMDQWYT